MSSVKEIFIDQLKASLDTLVTEGVFKRVYTEPTSIMSAKEFPIVFFRMAADDEYDFEGTYPQPERVRSRMLVTNHSPTRDDIRTPGTRETRSRYSSSTRPGLAHVRMCRPDLHDPDIRRRESVESFISGLRSDDTRDRLRRTGSVLRRRNQCLRS